MHIIPNLGTGVCWIYFPIQQNTLLFFNTAPMIPLIGFHCMLHQDLEETDINIELQLFLLAKFNLSL